MKRQDNDCVASIALNLEIKGCQAKGMPKRFIVHVDSDTREVKLAPRDAFARRKGK